MVSKPILVFSLSLDQAEQQEKQVEAELCHVQLTLVDLLNLSMLYGNNNLVVVRWHAKRKTNLTEPRIDFVSRGFKDRNVL